MKELLLTLVILYLAFFVRLMSSGAGLKRSGSVLFLVAVFGLGVGVLFAVIPLFISPDSAAKVFLGVAIFTSVLLLPVVALSRARDFLLPRSTVLEVVSLNVLVVMIGEPVGGVPDVQESLGMLQQAFLNPFVRLIPTEFAWMNLVISLWPTLLALWLATRGAAANRWLRFFPMLWVQVTSILWLIPASLTQLITADLTKAMDYLDLLFAALGLVHVVLTWLILDDALFAQRTTLGEGEPADSTEKIGVARRLADSMNAGPWPPLVYVAVAVLTWFAIRAMQSYLQDANPMLFGFVGAVAAGALALRFKERGGTRSWQFPVWLVSAVALVVSIHWLMHLDLLPAH